MVVSSLQCTDLTLHQLSEAQTLVGFEKCLHFVTFIHPASMFLLPDTITVRLFPIEIGIPAEGVLESVLY